MDCYIQLKNSTGMHDEIAKLYQDSAIPKIMEAAEELKAEERG